MKISEEGVSITTTDSAILTWIYAILALVFASLQDTNTVNVLIGASIVTITLWSAPILYRATHTQKLSYPQKDHKR